MEKETALKILRDLHDSELYSVRTALETLMPELMDEKHDDEFLRKWIIAVIRGVKEHEAWLLSPKTCDAAIAFLERLKERNPVEWAGRDLPVTPDKCFWKPTDNQMAALQNAIVVARAKTYGVELSTLYEDLKKIWLK